MSKKKNGKTAEEIAKPEGFDEVGALEADVLEQDQDQYEAQDLADAMETLGADGGFHGDAAPLEQAGENTSEEPALAPREHLTMIVESLLFAGDRPLTTLQLKQLLRERDVTAIKASLDSIQAQYETRGIRLVEVGGGYQFRTAPESATWVQKLVAGKPVRLSRAQLETLSIVAYRQPITRPEIDEIRGVDSGAVLKMLLDRNVIRILGKKEEPGRPLLYGTTKEFLEFFHLKDLKDLPTLREFHELNEENRAKVDAFEEENEPLPPPQASALVATELPAADREQEEELLDGLAAAERAAEVASAPFKPKREPAPPVPGAAAPEDTSTATE